MSLQPLYDGHGVEPVYQLRYDWTGWPSGDTMFPAETDEILAGVRELWAADGIRVLEAVCSGKQIQVLCSVTPQVAPRFSRLASKDGFSTRFVHAACWFV